MSEDLEIVGIKIPSSDWERTPQSVRVVVKILSEKVSEIEERLKKNSKNSSKPSSSNGFGVKANTKKEKGKKARGGQVGHQGQGRELYETQECDVVHEVKPLECKECGEKLEGVDEDPYRHQVVEIPPIKPIVTEYRLHQLNCVHCGEKTRAKLPTGAEAGFGDRLAALVGVLSSKYRQSHSMVKEMLASVYGISISQSSINQLRQLVSVSVAESVAQAQQYAQQQAIQNVDETSFSQGNSDGNNPQHKQGWMWTIVTEKVIAFVVALSRGQTIAKSILGEENDSIVGSDRYSCYNYLPVSQRQVCWAHLKRDFQAISERSGVSQSIGESLLNKQQILFRWWHRVRDGTLTREQFVELVGWLRIRIHQELTAAADLPVTPHERTPLAKTLRTCQQMLKVEPAFWTFVTHPGVEPTNNAAERALRPAVLWRKNSFGSQSERGSLFVSRMMTVSSTLKVQGREVLDFLTLAIQAKRMGWLPPSLLPQF
jgi:transposase